MRRREENWGSGNRRRGERGRCAKRMWSGEGWRDCLQRLLTDARSDNQRRDRHGDNGCERSVGGGDSLIDAM
jgi:hypothetical protein